MAMPPQAGQRPPPQLEPIAHDRIPASATPLLLQSLEKVSSALLSGFRLEPVLETVAAAGARLAGTSLSSVFLVDDRQNCLVPGAASGLPAEYLEALKQVPLGGARAGCCGACAASGRVTIIEDMSTDPRWQPYRDLSQRFGLQAVWSVPLAGQNHQVLGTLAAYYPQAYRPTPEQIAVLQVLGQHAGAAIETALLVRQLERQMEELSASAKQGAERERRQAAEARQERQERFRALGQMASGVAHNFNNVLTVILGHAELLLAKPSLDLEVRSMIEMVRTSALDAAGVIGRLTRFCRPDSPSDSFLLIQVNTLLSQVIKRTEPTRQALAAKLGIRLEVQTDLGAVPPVLANPPDLEEAIGHLLANAAEAMPRGGTITVRSFADDKHAIVEVADSGVGMPAELREHCFEPFYSTKTARGTGLSLATVHGIISRHGGSIEVTSQAGWGTCFTIRLPATSTKPTKEKETSPAAAKLHILCVDDEAAVRSFLQTFLARRGHEVHLAATGEEGLAAFQRGHFDLVITDSSMPGLDGRQLVQAIKACSPSTPIILLTGGGPLLQNLESIPADQVLRKPCRNQELLDAMERLTRRS